MIIFGIRAISDENIIENITKRITPRIVGKGIVELATLLKKGNISYNSPVITTNPEVYLLIKNTFTKDEMEDEGLAMKLGGEYAERLQKLTRIIVEKNIELHKFQFARLQTIPSITWFMNDDPSVESLDEEFEKVIRDTPPDTLLQKTTNFNFVPQSLCEGKLQHPGKDVCDEINAQFHSANYNYAMRYSASLSIPLLPKAGSGQIVIGNTEYLLPYAVLREHFNIFAIPPQEWTLDKNILLLECIALKHIDSPIIRIMTTPTELLDKEGIYRITATEICVLKQYGFHFYKYISDKFKNIYFCSKTILENCRPVESDDGVFMCDGKELGELYF
jgi:hypothetical protein